MGIDLKIDKRIVILLQKHLTKGNNYYFSNKITHDWQILFFLMLLIELCFKIAVRYPGRYLNQWRTQKFLEGGA